MLPVLTSYLAFFRKGKAAGKLSGLLLATLFGMVTGMPPSVAQNEYLTTVNYQNASMNRLSNIPGVTWINGPATYDENNGRFFFQGNATNAQPWNLYTVDAASGAVLYNPVCPSSGTGQIICPEYDKGTDTLYCLYTDAGGTAWFAWIEPANGNVHPMKTIPSFEGAGESTFDTKDHLYIFPSGQDLVVINAATGDIFYQSILAAETSLSNLVFDNTNQKLYATCSSSGLPYPQFDSISISNGMEHVIAPLPPMSFPQIYAYTIDETRGKYIFVAAGPPSSTCIRNSLYVLDLNTGNIVSKILYPYAQNTGLITAENVINFSFDNERGSLYALNWHPPPPVINPYVNIAVLGNPVCPGGTVAFTATPGTTIVNPSYQWLVNGVEVGTDSTAYSSDTLRDTDTVYCIITNNELCAVNSTDTSNRVVIQYKAPADASVSITASATSICKGDTVHFTATPVNGGASPSYQWLVNGNSQGVGTANFTDPVLNNGDVVSCIMASVSNCTANEVTASNAIKMEVQSANTSVSIAASATSICEGDTLHFTASPVNGGTSPSYQWLVNGNAIGARTAVFTTSSLADGDQVSCLMSGSLACSLPANSVNAVKVTVNPVPEIHLGNDTVIARGESVSLTPGISSDIAAFQWVPFTGLDNPLELQPVASPLVTTIYQLNVVTAEGCKSSGKKTVTVYLPLRMPNAFTPNGDGKNDIFRVPPSTPQNITNFSVYNRWGQRVFHTSEGSGGWDGRFDNRPQPTGVYAWVLEYESPLTGKRARETGTVVLMR